MNMKENTKCVVVFDDGEKVRSKNLIFVSREDDFFVFINAEKNNIIERINSKNIIRIEEVALWVQTKNQIHS